MERKILLVCAMTVMMATPSMALEFQQKGNSVMGEVGVAQTFDRTGGLDLVANTTTNLDRAGQTAQRIGLMGKIQPSGKNSLLLNGDAILGVRLRHFTAGIFSTL
jgi:hypothetical protein